tara:strand:+ start:395 stop:799 length:405 start_codon:yes stop_codon:yes gene_type:complete
MAHKWAKYALNERELYNPRFGGNLKEFIRRMVEDEGFTISNLFPYYEGRSYNIMHNKNIEPTDFDELAYQGLNYEHTNMTFIKEGHVQTVSIMMCGDEWCDVVPINDWTVPREKEDVVDRVLSTLRDEIMGVDA